MADGERERAGHYRLDLERGLPTSAADVAALRRARRRPAVPSPAETAAYLRFLAAFPPPTAEELRARRGPAEGPPFRLPAPDATDPAEP